MLRRCRCFYIEMFFDMVFYFFEEIIEFLLLSLHLPKVRINFLISDLKSGFDFYATSEHF